MLGGTMTAGGVWMPDFFFTTKPRSSRASPGSCTPNPKRSRACRPRLPQASPGGDPPLLQLYQRAHLRGTAEAEETAGRRVLHYHEFAAEARAEGD